jgi:phosphoribosyl 1,2-cyclic phosphodiesterase
VAVNNFQFLQCCRYNKEKNMKKNNAFDIRFWGVRGSHPVPGETTTRYGGNTPCVEVCAGEHTIIFDAGTGIIGLGRAMALQAGQQKQPVRAALFFSHLHHDHTQGFPFFAPAYFANAQFDIFVPDMYARDPKTVLADVMSAPTFPVAFQRTGAEKRVHSLQQTQVVIINAEGVTILHASHAPLPEDGVIVRVLHSYAHPQGVMIYRVEYQGKAVVYATDTEGYVNGDQRLTAFARGADLLIHDAQYTENHYLGSLDGAPITQGFGHSTAAMACKVAQDADAGQLVLFHHDPNYADKTIAGIEREARHLFTNTVAAREGQVVSLGERQFQPTIEDTLPLAKLQKRKERISNWAST